MKERKKSMNDNDGKEQINNQARMKDRKEGTNRKECSKYWTRSSPLALTQRGGGGHGEKNKVKEGKG